MSGSGIVAFDYTLWTATYPEFAASVNPTQAASYFLIAETFLNNTPTSPVKDAGPGGARAILLNMLTAHIAQLFAPQAGIPAPQTVGRISQASEGSVSVTLDMDNQTALAAWYNQTKYGAMYWAATAAYRTARYRSPPKPYLGVGGRGRRGFGW